MHRGETLVKEPKGNEATEGKKKLTLNLEILEKKKNQIIQRPAGKGCISVSSKEGGHN